MKRTNSVYKISIVLFFIVLGCTCHDGNKTVLFTGYSTLEHKDSLTFKDERLYRKWELVQVNYRIYIPDDIQSDRSMRQIERQLDSSEWLVFDFNKNGNVFIGDSLAGKFYAAGEAGKRIHIHGDWLDSHVPFFFNADYSLALYPTYMNMTTHFFQEDRIHHSVIFVLRKYYGTR